MLTLLGKRVNKQLFFWCELPGLTAAVGQLRFMFVGGIWQ